MGKETPNKNRLEEISTEATPLSKGAAEELLNAYNKNLPEGFKITRKNGYFKVPYKTENGEGVVNIPEWENIHNKTVDKDGREKISDVEIEKVIEAAIKYPEKDFNEANALIEKEEQNKK